MPSLAKLEEQRDKAEAAKQAAAERQTQLEKQIAEMKKQERAKRERTIGKLAIEAGLGEWNDTDLLTAFQRLATGSTVETTADSIAAD